jgi:hypothetical protein
MKLLQTIDDRGLTKQFTEAVAFDIMDQSEFIATEDTALLALLRSAATTIEQGQIPPDTVLGIVEFFLGVESIDHYMEDFLNGFTVPDRE